MTEQIDGCTLIIFGAAGDLTKRLLMPALYNLACDKLLPKHFSIIGMARETMTTEEFRAKMTEDIATFSTRRPVDQGIWQDFVSRIQYTQGEFEDVSAFQRLSRLAQELDEKYQSGGNILFFMATPPAVFGLVSDKLGEAGFKQGKGWRRIIVEKPFGTDLASAISLNKEILSHWSEDQIYRIDHYLGKETVQNILAFRFSNGMFEPLWNKNHVDHIQFTVAETVGVEKRGRYYDKAGVLRDMVQNHMFQMLAYLCMESPSSFRPDAIRNEKAKVLEAVRIMKKGEDVLQNAVRGQYAPRKNADGTKVLGYREEPDVDPRSTTETFAALRLFIDNWRWEGVPIYLRSGKSLWKRGTEIVVQFKKAPEVIFRDTPEVPHLDANQLIFHIQPDQGIEIRFQAKKPGPAMALQKVDMRFDYTNAFDASRGTGYEVLLYRAILGDATLFSRTDLVETAWRIAQPILDTWASASSDLATYEAGSWGPKAAFNFIERDGRRWVEVMSRGALEKVPLFQTATPVFLASLALVLRPDVFEPGDTIVKKGEPGNEMYFIARGEVEVIGDGDRVLSVLSPGQYFGETALLTSEPRTATVRAKTQCDVYTLGKAELKRVLSDHPGIARTLEEVSRTRYGIACSISDGKENRG